MGPGEEVGYPSQHEKDAVGVDDKVWGLFGVFC